MEQVFRSIADHSHVGIWLLDQDGTIVYTNEAAAKIWAVAPQLKKEEYQTYRAWDYETGKRIEIQDWPAMRAMKSGKPVLDHLMRIERFDGDMKFVLISAIPIFSEDGKLTSVLVMNHDVSELKASEAKREELTKILSHDIKNPLHAIKMSTQLLEKKLAEPTGPEKEEKIKHYLSLIVGSVNSALDLVKDILDREKNERGVIKLNYGMISPTDLLNSLRPIYDPLAEEKGLVLEWQITLPEDIYGDKEKICQVISNIVGNAIKFTPPGGQISVMGLSTKDNIVFSIHDTGPGIPQGILSRIFEKDFQGSSQAVGTGLGLYIAQMMVKAHGGAIRASSEPGEGTTLSFTIPRKKTL